jgi:hypothetical protein
LDDALASGVVAVVVEGLLLLGVAEDAAASLWAARDFGLDAGSDGSAEEKPTGGLDDEEAGVAPKGA